jgi:RNA polymerase sigma factor (sigma-70 family)
MRSFASTATGERIAFSTSARQRNGALATLQDVRALRVAVASRSDSGDSADTARAVTTGYRRWLADCEGAQTKVYRGLIAMGASPEDAEDALQDAFEQALRIETPADKPEGWLFVVALRRWRRHRWRQRIFQPLAWIAGTASTDDRDGQIDLLTELGHLTERQRTVVVARHVLGLSQKETADALGIAAGTVGSIGYHAIRKLRERLGERDERKRDP